MSIHPTAIIHPSVIIDSTNDIGPYVIIEENVQMGKNNRFMAHAFVGKGTILGDGNDIHIGAVLGHSPQDKRYKGEPTQLKIGNNNMIREYVTIHRSTHVEAPTTIGNDCMLMGACHVAHDCVLGNNIIMANMAGLAGHVHVEDRVFIGGGAMVHQFVSIGRVAILAGNSRFSMDIPPFVVGAEKNQIWGINIIGLRRASFPKETIQEIKELYRLFFKDSSPRGTILEKIQARGFKSPEVQEFIAFVKNSKRGVCRADAAESSKDPEIPKDTDLG